MLERIFHLQENNTTVRRELLAGLTTFMTMAYVVVVNPRILSEAGMPVDGVLFATCISAAVATLIMGLWANYPIALAPGMSLNAYFTYSIVLGRGVPWQTALGVVFLSGMLFLLLTLTKVREQIVNGIPILRSGSDFRQLSYIEATQTSPKKWQFTIQRHDITSSIPEDPTTAAVVSSLSSSLQKKLQKPIGYSSVDLDSRFSVPTPITSISNSRRFEQQNPITDH